MRNQQLISVLADILPHYRGGISEYDLLQVLQAPPYQLFKKGNLGDSLLLFQTHFLLFNALYQLRDEWFTQQFAQLEIVSTQICMQPWRSGQQGIQTNDPLRDYYLNWDNFEQTQEADVEQLLAQFWQRMGGLREVKENDVEDAFKALELHPKATAKELKMQYRRLLHKYHPDKGGSNQRTADLHKAFQLVDNYLKTTISN